MAGNSPNFGFRQPRPPVSSIIVATVIACGSADNADYRSDLPQHTRKSLTTIKWRWSFSKARVVQENDQRL